MASKPSRKRRSGRSRRRSSTGPRSCCVSEPGRERVHAESAGAQTIRRIVENVAKVVRAPEETLQFSVLCLVSEGHLILEDFPGVGKTMLAKALARSLESSFSRL